MNVTIRRFERADIPRKAAWINNPENNRYLHYDLPLEIGKTERWFDKNLGRTDRYDAVIEEEGIPVGLVGLLRIDGKNHKAEYYISMGETAYKGKGIAKQASRLILKYGFEELGLNKIYLFTEAENIGAQKLFERIGFVREGILRQDICFAKQYVDRIMYGILRTDYLKRKNEWENEHTDTSAGSLQS
jgi:diamine N-acetyltransferase